MKTIVLNTGRRIGLGEMCFIAAEIGLNHNGDFDLAIASIEAAAEAGVDGVKFQNYRTEDFLSDRSLTYRYVSQGVDIEESQWDMFKRCEAPDDWWPRLKRRCDELGVAFFSTPTSHAGVDDLLKVGASLIKNGSDYLTNTELIAYMARSGLPVVLSTGMADRLDIERAINAVKTASATPPIVLHCTSAYPTPIAHVNLRRMETIRRRFDVLVGFSDHTEGIDAAAQSIGHGACFIEKHFTVDRDLPGPDHRFSSTPGELATLVRAVRAAEERAGSGDLVPDAIEAAARAAYRVSVVAAVALEPGARLTRDAVAFRRPGTGILPDDLPRYVDRPLRRAITPGEPIRYEDVE